MAFQLESMSIDYKKLLKLVPTQRAEIAQSGAINDMISVMTPGQLVSLFPRYYRQSLPDVGKINQYAASMDSVLSGGTPKYSSSPKSSTGTATETGSDKTSYTRTQTPEEKAVEELMKKANIGKETGAKKTSAIADTKGRIISTASTNISPQERALLDTIAMGNATSGKKYWESPDYNTIVGGGKFESFDDHPDSVGHVSAAGSSDAAGRYQFLNSTWDDVVTRYNNRNPDDPISDFSPGNQDKAALFLARERYKSNTGRDLDVDLASPPSNFGALIKSGLGFAGPGTFLTWEAFIKKNPQEIQDAFESNYDRNIGYVQEEIEAAADSVKDLQTATAKFEPAMLEQLDERLQKWYENASEIQKKKFETALEKLGTEQFNDVMKNQPVNTPTLDAVSSTPIEGGPLMLPVGGSMTGKSIVSDKDVPFSGGSYGSRSFGGPRGKNQLHTGVDIPGRPGDPVLAVDNGVVKQMRKSPSGYGYTLDVQYSDGTIHRMAHLGTNDGGWKGAFAEDLKVGSTVAPGQRIGTMGYSGNAGSDFPHVHYEVIDPDYYERYEGRPPGRISGRTEKSFEELKEGRIDPREWYAKRQAEYAKQQEQKIKQNAEELRSSSPVNAAQDISDQNEMATKANTTPAQAIPTETAPSPVSTSNTAPAMATGGLKDVPPGENIAGINTDTGKLEFVANDRERIRVDPATLENTQQSSAVTQEDTARLETQMTPQQQRNPQPVAQPLPDPMAFDIMTAGFSAVPPSQVRATNRAKLYGEGSNNLVNGHFA